MTAQPVIAIEGVTHAYETDTGPLPVLNDISFEIAPGGFTAVVGPSGCGKSTLAKLVSGLIKPNAGRVMLDGKPVTSPRPTVGMAFQNPVLLEWRSILRNVLLPLEIVRGHGLNREQAEGRAHELLALVGLSGFEDKRPSELSGGMRQRASLCRALIHRPSVLILDEPFGALDAFTREDLWQIMFKLRVEQGVTCLLITHDLRESMFLADEVVVLSDRPAGIQHRMTVPLGRERSIEDLYRPEIVECLAELRRQIQIAQGRHEPASASAKGEAA